MNTTQSLDDPPRPIEFSSPKVIRVRPGLGRWLARGSLVALLAPFIFQLFHVLMMAVGIDLDRHLEPVRSLLFPVGIFVSLGLAVFSVEASRVSLPRPSPAELRVRKEGVEITQGGRTRMIPKSDITDGLVIPWRPQSKLELHLRGGDVITAIVRTEGTAYSAIEMLGFDASHHRTVIALGDANRQLVAGGCAFFLSLPVIIVLLTVLPNALLRAGENQLMFVVFPLLVMLSVFVVARSYRPLVVDIGTDGILLHKAWGNRFIPYEKLEDAELHDGDILLYVKREPGNSSSSPERIQIKHDSHVTLEALMARIQEAKAAGKAGGDESQARAELLDPQGRPLGEWRAALKALVHQASDYRRAGITVESIMAVLDDSQADRGRRLGAAMALRVMDHPEAKERIRVAADACASEELRVALEQAAEDELDEETLKRALHS